MVTKTTLASLLFANLLFNSQATDETVQLPSSCTNLPDGDHYLQPLSHSDYQSLTSTTSSSTTLSPVVLATCSNGYTIINPAQDSNWQSIFSSFHSYHTTYSGPDLNDHVTWEEWFLPSTLDSDMKFAVSEDCNECLFDSDSLEFGDNTVYYMSGDSYGCNWPTKNLCDFDADTLECYKCGASEATETDQVEDSSNMWGKCGHMPMASYSTVHANHAWCTEHTGGSQPSIGMTNQYCVCYKPSTTDTNSASVETLNYHEQEQIEQEEGIYNSDMVRTVHLTQEDFKYGTYRITKPGTYIVDEDIEFDFNAGDLDDPNAEGAWYPTADQSEHYPGAGEKDGWYWLGFFAGITVECDDVTIDLNGHELKMSPAFYIQQRWFIVIELASKAFLDGQGPTWTGTGIKFTSNTVVKNGIIGLTSHIGIHGSNCTDVTIEDVVIRNFETHGIGINEHNGLTIQNVEIGPSVNGHLGLNGMYNLARISLPLLRQAAEDVGDERTIQFGSRGTEKYIFSELVDELQEQMDLMFRWAYFGEEGEGEQWESAYDMFANPTGISRSGVVYGMVLRPRGASVFNYGKYAGGTSTNLKIDNVEIHDLTLGTDEFIAVGTHWNTWVRDTFNAPVPFEFATDNNLDPVGEAIYTGNAWTDCVLALRKFSQDWWYLGRLAMPDDIIKWAESGKTFDEVVTVNNECNFDALGHVAKGVIGIRAEYLEDSEINDLKIHNLMNVGSLGSDKCGAYKDGRDGGMPLQDKITNVGYGGTTTRAISMYGVKNTKFNSLEIENVMSLNGPAHGLFFIKDCEVEVNDASMKHIESGIGNTDDYSRHQWPNPAAEACAVSWITEEDALKSYENVNAQCVSGHTGCMRCADVLGSKEYISCSGEIDSCEDSVSYKTAIGTYGVSSEGKVSLLESDVSSSSGSSMEVVGVNYVSVINNPLFTETSSIAKMHRELYHKSGRAKRYKESKERWTLGQPSEHLGFYGFVWVLFMAGLGYLAYKVKGKNDKRNGNSKRQQSELNVEIDGGINMKFSEYMKQQAQRGYNGVVKEVNRLVGNAEDEEGEYDDMDQQVTHVNYQENALIVE